jgi:hypothetical protein
MSTLTCPAARTGLDFLVINATLGFFLARGSPGAGGICVHCYLCVSMLSFSYESESFSISLAIWAFTRPNSDPTARPHIEFTRSSRNAVARARVTACVTPSSPEPHALRRRCACHRTRHRLLDSIFFLYESLPQDLVHPIGVRVHSPRKKTLAPYRLGTGPSMDLLTVKHSAASSVSAGTSLHIKVGRSHGGRAQVRKSTADQAERTYSRVRLLMQV